MSVVNAAAQRDPRTAVVTGGTGGIGRAIAHRLAAMTARLIIVGRDAAKGARAQRAIAAAGPACDVHFLQADLSLVREALRVADEVEKLCPALNYLVHSAGVIRGRRVMTAEGLESNFATNYLSRFALTERLVSQLQKAGRPGEAARILLVAHPGFSGAIHYDDVNLTTDYSTIRAFRQFHFANDVFAIELSRRLQASDGRPVTITCLHPGPTKTRIDREMPLWMKLMVRVIVNPLFSRLPDAPAGIALELLSEPRFEGESGALFSFVGRFRRIAPPESASDPAEGARLWSFSQSCVRSALETAGGAPLEDENGSEVPVTGASTFA